MLKGLKIVELATYVAAPGAASLLAEWGADVVKVEPASGDPMRDFFSALGTEDAANPVFEVDNRGKRSVSIDIRQPEGAELVRRLVAEADVFVTNVRAPALGRIGLDAASLRAAFPRLVYTAVTGYGLTGPDADRAGFDVAAFWARSGLTSAMTLKGGEPLPPRTAVGDHVCALGIAAATLAAVVAQRETGEGRLVEASLLRAGTYVMATDLAIQLKLGKLASTRPRLDQVNPLGNNFRDAEGRWFAIIPRQSNTDWPALARAVGHPEWVEDARFAKTRERRANGAALVGLLDEAFAAMSTREVRERLDLEDIVWAPIQTPAEVVEDPQAHAAGCFQPVEIGGERFLSPAGPVRFPDTALAPPAPAPALGADTDKVLAELGFSDAAVLDLRSRGVVA